MSPSNGTTKTEVPTKTVTMTVFDLQKFDDVHLYKEVELPAKPTSIEEALAAVGNDREALLQVIYDGLVERAVEQAKVDPTTFYIDDDEAETPALYAGKPTDEKKKKSIGLAVLNLAKAMGYEKTLPAEKKTEIKKQALQIFKDTPALIAALQ